MLLQRDCMRMKFDVLPLTAIEELFFWADQPGCPSRIHGRMYFTGVLQREALELAVKAVVARHPLFRSRVEIGKGGPANWVVMDDWECPLEWREGPIANELKESEPLDLRRQPGLRLEATVDMTLGRSELRIIFHHACADGEGIQNFTEDLMLAYAAACDAGAPKRHNGVEFEISFSTAFISCSIDSKSGVDK